MSAGMITHKHNESFKSDWEVTNLESPYCWK